MTKLEMPPPLPIDWKMKDISTAETNFGELDDGRLELRINDVVASLPGSRLTAEYEISHDDVRDTRHEVGLRLRIPLSGSKPARSLASLSSQQRRMLDGVERDTDIITVRSKAEKVEDALTGTDFDRVAYASPGNNVTSTSNTAGDNSLIILNGGNRRTQTLQANQTLQGGGSTIVVRGLASGLELPFTAPGAAGRLVQPGGDNSDNLVIAGSNTHVAGITIIGSGGSGSGDGVDLGNRKSNVFLTDLNIRRTSDDGVDIDNGNSDIWLINVNTSNTDDGGVSIGNRNTGVSIIGGSIINSDDYGIRMGSRNVVSIKDLRMLRIDEDALRIDGNRNQVTITGGLIRNIDGDGIDVNGSNNIASINGTVFARIDDDVIVLDGSDNEFTIANIFVSNSPDVVNVEGRDNKISISNSTFSNITDDVFDLDNTGNQLLVTGSIFNGVVDDVFRFENAGGSEVLISNNIFNGPIGGFFLTFEDNGVTDIQVGSTGNTNNTGVDPLPCRTTGSASFTGGVEFLSSTTVNAGNC